MFGGCDDMMRERCRWLAGRSGKTAVMAESGLHALDHAVQLFVHVELDDHIVL